MQPLQNDKTYWDNRYLAGDTGWDIGDVSIPLKEYIDQYQNKNAAILIPGCGNAYEAAYLLQNGFTNVTIIDISSTAIEKLRERFVSFEGKQLHIICGDFFKLTQKFDLVLEQTFFCALPIVARKAYAAKMHDLLKKDGKLTGVLFNRAFSGGPPFGGVKEDYVSLFSKKFQIRLMADCYNSIRSRAGTELFFILTV